MAKTKSTTDLLYLMCITYVINLLIVVNVYRRKAPKTEKQTELN